MLKVDTIVKNYMYKLSINEDIDLENYIKEIFEGISNAKLKEYCKENSIYIRSNFNKERLLQSIYGICNSILGCRILATKTIDNETQKEFYYRLYINF